MAEQQKSNRISSGVVAVVSAAVVAVSGGVAWFTLNSPPAQTPTSTVPRPGEKVAPIEQTAEIYWLKDNGKNLELVPQKIKLTGGDKPNQVLEAAFQNLLTGPTEGTGSTTIPQGTKLLGLKVENNDIHINLSEEFTSGGGSASMNGRVGQVVYTATSLDRNAKVYIEVNGQKLEVLGGEGLELEQPLTRDSFNKNYSL
ncbi:MAG: GerMN domain-containing protein [Cyanomargarita calcarea GSE-NOS-MK-12-04C]|jgi:spore germination protein GerM|uniref:GerMN domain-containing protein n=1 Tax=Cyanomargarita calcarea GSE-NOS-MK-12-04C TaxID=2839659 RepID=A0A951UU63_9CYAN|nr:GerMN domain-containing protein [Cyanomargarita calcarea GSE-NOS-MK-12-04C]